MKTLKLHDIILFHSKIIKSTDGSDGVRDLTLIDRALYEVWLKYHMRTCRERSILGMSNHGLVIVRKN